MVYETKVILTLLAERISRAKTAKEAFEVVRLAANTEGLKLPTYEDFQKEIIKEEGQKSNQQ